MQWSGNDETGGGFAMLTGTHPSWRFPTSPLSDLSIAEAAAIGEGMVASEVSQAATASTAPASAATKSAVDSSSSRTVTIFDEMQLPEAREVMENL